jgi:hypothetical protein
MNARSLLIFLACAALAVPQVGIPASLVIQPLGDEVQLGWQGPGVLESSAMESGAWEVLSGKVTPAVVPSTLSAEFFRLRLPLFRLNDTGQTNCYNTNGTVIPPPEPGTALQGQDAQHPSTAMQFLDNGDGTVSDLNTGLMWQQVPGSKVPWTNALEDAAIFSLAGYGDWRLPTIKELYSLIDFQGSSAQTEASSIPYLDTNVFGFNYGDTDAGERLIDVQEWSSTRYVGTTMNGDPTAFGVNFADGRIKGYPIAIQGNVNSMIVRYVRGPTNYGINQFVDNGDGTVTDLATGLMWTQEDGGSLMNWEEALDSAATNTTAGHTDWRLPDAKELQSIVDYTRAPLITGTAAIDTNFFRMTSPESYFWTSTTHLEGSPQTKGRSAVYVCFGRGMGYMQQPPNSGNYVFLDVHGAGAQRSDPKSGDPADYPNGFGPQGDDVRIYNHVRYVRGGLTLSPEVSLP